MKDAIRNTNKSVAQNDYETFIYAYEFILSTLSNTKWRWAFYYRLAQHYIPSGYQLYRFLEHILLFLQTLDHPHNGTVFSLFQKMQTYQCETLSTTGQSSKHSDISTPKLKTLAIRFLIQLWIGEYMGFLSVNQWIYNRRWRTTNSASMEANQYAYEVVCIGFPEALHRIRNCVRTVMFSIKTTPPHPDNTVSLNEIVRPYTFQFPSWFSKALYPELSVTITSEQHVANAWTIQFLRRHQHKPSVLGFDTETDQNVPLAYQGLDLLQFATHDGYVLLYMFPSSELQWNTTAETPTHDSISAATTRTPVPSGSHVFPHGLRYLLEDNTSITKVGCACDSDAAILYESFSVFPRRVCDLQYCVDQLGVISPDTVNRTNQIRRYSLADIVAGTLDETMHCTRHFGKQIACSQWRYTIWTRGTLATEQIQYAAMDAFACALVYIQCSTPSNPLRLLPEWIIHAPPHE